MGTRGAVLSERAQDKESVPVNTRRISKAESQLAMLPCSLYAESPIYTTFHRWVY